MFEHAGYPACILNGTSMKYKFVTRYRTILFALIMSFSTALIVSGTIIYLNAELNDDFVARWLGAFISAWPIVFAAILVMAPIVNKFLDIFIEQNSDS